MEKKYDVLIKNVRQVNETVIDVAIHQGKIVEVSNLIEATGKTVIDGKGTTYISAGWIDDHVHCNEVMDLYHDHPDEVGVKHGVTTIIDAGSTGADNINEFYQNVKTAKTNVFALINIARQGIVTQDELSRMENINAEMIAKKLLTLPAFIVGLKARMSQSVVKEQGILPLIEAKKIQKENHLPLMVHIGSAPPKLKEICSLLERGDMITHCFNGKENNILDAQGNIFDFVIEAQQRGVAFDVGHGTASFSMAVAKQAYRQCFYCQSISTDSYRENRLNGPVYDMATTLEKMIYVGYSLEEVISMITVYPASFFNLSTKGKLEAGFDGDITLFDVIDDPHEVKDSTGEVYTLNQRIVVDSCLVNGEVFKIGEMK